jgi:O-antigen biosynthesis protein
MSVTTSEVPAARSISVVVPVKDGARFLPELLAAVQAQAGNAASFEVLVIDSGSVDDSVELARAGGARVMEIEPASFGHGRTRNLGAESTSGELVVFLTQDATPLPGWLAGLQRGFDLAGDVGAVYGPHRARPETSPMIARELEGFFATHEQPGGGAMVQREGDLTFLSNVNAAYRRDCWEALRFADVPYSEDQGFARAMLAAGWAKAYVPEAAVLHAHDYSPTQFMRRYFDEYRGLRSALGHVETFGVRSTVRDVRALVAADRVWMAEQGVTKAEVRCWTGRATVHHTGRKVFSAMGSRAHALPAPLQRRLSLEGTVAEAPPLVAGPPDGPVAGKPIAKASKPVIWDAVRRYAKDGPAPLLPVLPGQTVDAPLHIACVIPPFSRGSGGHNSILQIMRRLELMGHTVSFWIDDELGFMKGDRPARIRRDMRDWFAPVDGPVFYGFDQWYGADVVVATGWQTAHNVMMLPGCRARAYLIHDHETEFYATSVESRWAEATYGLDMHAICASPWLERLVRERYGRTTSVFDFGVDHGAYRPRPVPRRRDTIALYGRDVTPRRAVPLALMALQELKERRPDLRVLSFGNDVEIDMPVPYEHLGILSPEQLSWVFSEATVGLVLSLTNYSLIPQEMLACGLPCVDLAGISAEGVFGSDGPVALSAFDPVAMADAIEHLLAGTEEWERHSTAGVAFVQGRTWDKAAAQVETGLRLALTQP